MKKKLVGVLSILFLLFSCFAMTACGDKYKDLGFKVSYAFSSDGEWHEMGEKLSLNFDSTNGQMTFDENGNANIYVKVEILNVKEKDLGKSHFLT